MNITDPQELWNAIGRLYSSTVALKDATEALKSVAESHERRLDYSEVTVVSLREEVKRLRTELSDVNQRLNALERGKN